MCTACNVSIAHTHTLTDIIGHINRKVLPTNLVHTGNSLRKLLTARASIDAAHIATNMSPDRITITVTPNLSFTWARIYSETLTGTKSPLLPWSAAAFPTYFVLLPCFWRYLGIL